MATYAKGHVRAQNKDQLMLLSHLRHGGRLKAMRAAPTPAVWDSVALGWVGACKDQKSCGDCWLYSGTGVVEIAYNLAGMGGGPNTFILSEQFGLDCGQNGGCNGDDNTTTLAAAKANGIPLTSAYGPYRGGAGRCNYKAGQQLFKIDDWGFADSAGGQGITSVADIKSAIMHYGCVGSGIAADDAFMNTPAGQVFKGSGNTDIDHDIILVGWDDNKGAWKLRNSWGKSWADGGYVYISYGVNMVGSEAVWAVVSNPNPPPSGWGDLTPKPS